MKKDFCCKTADKGCPHTWHGSLHLHTHVEVSHGVGKDAGHIYDCHAGFSNWKQGWSVSKRLVWIHKLVYRHGTLWVSCRCCALVHFSSCATPKTLHQLLVTATHDRNHRFFGDGYFHHLIITLNLGPLEIHLLPYSNTSRFWCFFDPGRNIITAGPKEKMVLQPGATRLRSSIAMETATCGTLKREIGNSVYLLVGWFGWLSLWVGRWEKVGWTPVGVGL